MKWQSLFNPKCITGKIRYLIEHVRQKKLRQNYKKLLPKLKKETKEIYALCGFDFDKAQTHRNFIISQSPCLQKIDPQLSCISEHWTLFSALALTFNDTNSLPIKRILELGTYNAETTHYLSLLFPEAQIVTVDLPDDSPFFVQSYGRESEEYRKQFLAYRTQMLAKDNIKFIQINSFLLPSLSLTPFDLIWVDACHEYPEVAWDTCNAYHLLKQDGWMLCDDIYQQSVLAEGLTNSSYGVLAALQNYGLCDVSYILKRFDSEFSADPCIRKHIAVVRKTT